MTKEYVLETGLKGSRRLEVQNQMHLKDHTYYLEQAGLCEGMVVCDIGCGNGAMTEYLARQVGNSGKVYAIDISQPQIDIASERMDAANLHNVEFIKNDITSSNFNIKADLIFIRLVLMHLKDPFIAIKNMKKLLKPTGVIISFESIMDNAFERTQSPIIKEYVRSVLKLGEIKEQNYSLGKELPKLYENEGFNVEHHLLEPALPKEHFREYHLLLLEELSDVLIEYNLACKAKIDEYKYAFQSLPLEEIGLDKLDGTIVLAKW